MSYQKTICPSYYLRETGILGSSTLASEMSEKENDTDSYQLFYPHLVLVLLGTGNMFL